jgi:hypothetical protein
VRGQIVQWRGDNADEADHLVSSAHLARADKDGAKLRVVGVGLNIELDLGDSLILDGDRLGVLRHATEKPMKETGVTWQGNNLQKVKDFLKTYQVRFAQDGRRLKLYGDNSDHPWFILDLGDQLLKRDGQIIVSKHA